MVNDQVNQSKRFEETDPNTISKLYHALMDSWNTRSANRFSDLFWEDGNVIGFDGSQMNGRKEIDAELGRIFSDHPTARYISKIKEIRLLTEDTAILRATAGMVPPGKTEINPAVNAVHTLVAVSKGGQWKIALFQNTPAAYHGRPELSERHTQEIREMLHATETQQSQEVEK